MRVAVAVVLSVLCGGLMAADVAPSTLPGTATETLPGAEAPVVDYQQFDWGSLSEIPRWVIRNEKAAVEISSWRASVRRIWLLDAHPIVLPEWRGGTGELEKAEDGKVAPLSVLDLYNPADQQLERAFGFATDMHSYVGSLDLHDTNLGPSEGPWELIAHSDNEVSLGYTSESGIAYSITYTMDPVRPTVHAALRVVNGTEVHKAWQPTLIAVNGIHQDDPGNENYDLTVLGSFDGDAEGKGATFEKWGMPEPLKRVRLTHPDLGTPVIPAGRIDYIGLKSRFFTAFWSPGSVQVVDPNATEEPVAPAPTGGDMGAMFDDASATEQLVVPSNDHLIQLAACGYLQRLPNDNTARQAWIGVRMFTNEGDAFAVAPGEALEASWSLTATGMRKSDLAVLTPAEARIEYADGFYNFFKLLVQVLTLVLNAVVFVVSNYGVAVIIFVVLVKAALHRLNVKQQKGMANMQRMAPKLKALQERYKADRQTLARKQMEMMREEGVNPMGGCMPLLIQMPIFFAMFQTFRHYAPMREHGFLWINDLTMPDQLMHLFTVAGFPVTLNLLPLLYIGIMTWSSFSTKIPDDAPDQQKSMAKMMRWLPIIFGVICYNFPAGLLLYMCCSALIGSLEMRWIRKKYGASAVGNMMVA
ncbi:MAG: membrane protein insertase YidC [Planctomycetota bacterium]|nr:membrane protein insertase YidC [Planctomycetota bacterium]